MDVSDNGVYLPNISKWYFFRHLLGKLLFHHQIWWYPYFQTIPDRVGTDIFAAKISNYAMVYAPSDSVYT